MSVMECDRKDCDHIMCDRLIRGTQQYYICWECMSELEKWKEGWVGVKVGEVPLKIDEFMGSKKGTMNDCADPEEVEKKFRSLIEGVYDGNDE